MVLKFTLQDRPLRPFMQPQVELERHDGVATLWLNRPAARNALTVSLLAELDVQIQTIAQDTTLRALVVAGRGDSFCAGGDLAEMAACAPAEIPAWQMRCAATLDRLAALPVPVIAAMHGHAFGGGFLLSLYCDLRIAATGTQIGFPGASRQWIPPWAMSRLAAWIGPARAQQFLLTAGFLDADAAFAWRLVDRVEPQKRLVAIAQQTAGECAKLDRPVVAAVRSFFSQLPGQDHSHWDRQSTELFAALFTRPEAQAAITSFLARRSQ
jgi:enoyl-CoA hydratase/carnithine racemase